MALTKVIGAGLGTVTEDQVIGGATPTLTIGDAGAEDAKIVFDGNAQDYHIGLDDSADTLVIGKGSALGTTTSMSFDANGIITKPLQPAFHARPASNRNNMGTGADVDMLFGTEVYDQNGDFDGSNGYTFTAPVTGKYLFTCMLVMLAVDKDYDYIQTRIATSNRNYQNFIDPGTFAGDANYWTQTVTALADMDANDTCKIIFSSTGGAEQLDISSASTFTGCLIA